MKELLPGTPSGVGETGPSVSLNSLFGKPRMYMKIPVNDPRLLVLDGWPSGAGGGRSETAVAQDKIAADGQQPGGVILDLSPELAILMPTPKRNLEEWKEYLEENGFTSEGPDSRLATTWGTLKTTLQEYFRHAKLRVDLAQALTKYMKTGDGRAFLAIKTMFRSPD